MPDESAPPFQAPAPEAMEAFCDWLRLLELGQEADFEAFCAARPAEAEDLRRLRAEYERVTAILERLSPAHSFSARLRERYGASVDPGIDLSGDAPGAASGEGPGSSSGSGRMTRRLNALRPSTQRYEPRGEIARGGMGAILKVWDGELRRMLAMKVVLARRGARDDDSDVHVGERRLSRFLEEAQITAQLDHPGIVPVHDLGIDEKGRVYFTMQLIEGRDLREVFELARLRREGWSQSRVLWAMLRVCEAMAYAHSKGVVHRDLKPANIMVGRFGETYVMDWGLAKVLGREDPHDMRLEERREGSRRVITDRSEGSDDEDDSPLKTMDGDVVGTPAYMPPEQALGRLEEVGPHSDVYSVGAMLYHLLSGHMPYEPLGEKVPTTTILEAVRSTTPWPLRQFDSGLDPELVAICEKAMARDVGRRYADMIEFADDLRASLEGRVVRAYETGVLYEFKKWVRRNQHLAAALAAILVLAVGSVIGFIAQQQGSLRRLAAANAETESERVATLEAKQKAESYAAELLVERDRLQKAKQDALEKRALAEEHLEMATDQARINRRLSYRSQIVAVDYGLRLEDVSVARAGLAAAEEDLRGWEWRHLRLATDGSVGELLTLDVGIADLSVSQDGQRAIGMGLDLVARYIDTTTGRTLSDHNLAGLPTLSGANARRLRIALSPNGGFAVAALLGPLMPVFNTLTGRTLGSLSFEGPRTALSFSHDGLRLIAAAESRGPERDGVAAVWENKVTSFPPVATLVGHEGPVLAAALSPDGARALTGGSDGTLRLWDAGTGAELGILAADRSREITAVVWAPPVPGLLERAAVAYRDGALTVWDVGARSLVAVMYGHAGPVGALCFAADGVHLYSGSDDATVRRWRLASGAPAGVFRGHEQAVTGLALIADGSRVASSSLDGSVRIWDPSWDPAVTRIPLSRALLGADFGPGGAEVVACPREGWPRRYDAVTGEELGVYVGDRAGDRARGAVAQRALAASRAGLLATVGDDQRVRLFDARTGAELATFTAQRRRIESLALSSDGERVATGASDGSVWVWRWREGGPPTRLEGHLRGVLGLDFSPDGARLATVGRDRYLRIWDVAQAAQVEVVPDAHPALPIQCVAFAPDGETLATGSDDGTARLWRRGDDRPLHVLAGNAGNVTAVAFDPRGERLVSGHSSGAVVLWDWDVLGGYRLMSLDAHERAVTSVAFSPDGTRILSCGSEPPLGESTLVVWESNPARPRHDARERAADERRRAAPLVERLYAEHGEREAVLEALAAEGLAPALAAAARRLARERADDPRWMAERLLRRLVLPELDAGEVARALAEAERLLELDAPSAAVLSALGAAEVRAGRAREGLETLRSAALERVRTGLLDEARDALFRALALTELDRAREAREALELALGRIANLQQAGDSELGPLMELEPLARRVEARLRAGAGAGGQGG